jgi:hypothetical protein
MLESNLPTASARLKTEYQTGQTYPLVLSRNNYSGIVDIKMARPIKSKGEIDEFQSQSLVDARNSRNVQYVLAGTG